MLKKSIATAMLVMLPIAANASWTFNTWAKSAGGTITSRNGTQTSVNGSFFKSYTTHSTKLTATVTANAGYTISNVVLNGVSLGAQGASYTNALISGGAGANVAQSLYASFKAALLPMTAGTGAGGYVSPTSVAGIYYNTKLTSPLVFTFQPKSGYSVAGITGAPAAALTVYNATTGKYDAVTLPAPVNKAVKATIPAGSVLTAGFTLSGTFSSPKIRPIIRPPQPCIIGTPNTLIATDTNGDAATGTWKVSGGPYAAIVPPATEALPVTVTLTGTNPANFTPTIVGDYSFKFTGGAESYSTTASCSSYDYKTLAQNQCTNCHNENNIGGVGMPTNVLNNWAASANYDANLCSKCHSGAGTGGHPGTLVAPVADHDDKGLTCVKCHNNSTNGDAHAISTTAVPGCIGCHSTNQNAGAGFVQDNAGVRPITTEFAKWSHHVTGVTLQDAHCAACHLEGKVVGGKIVTDPTYHVADNKTHLRNADTNADIQWDPAAPSFSNMDNFCLSCHDSDGATGISAIQAIMIPAAGKTASATNPFADTISNQYDMLERPAVIDAKSQFNTSNPSHHAVLGQKYTGRTRVAGARSVDTVAFASNSSAALPGKRSTIYDAGKFDATYATLSPAPGTSDTSLGDDSVLHCADCHTVGQFRAADVGTKYNNAVIGAHGSNNEYLLRNNIGTDARHQGAETTTGNYPTVGMGTKPYLVCFNCHAFSTYGSVGSATSAAGQNHAGEYANTTRCNGPDNTVFGNMTGEARLRSMNTILTATGATGYGKPAGAMYGNVFGIQCNNCHNSGYSAGNLFGGIHGAKDATYIDGMGNTTKHYRFMPGLANVMYVPGTKGGFTGGTLAPYNSYSGNRNGIGTGDPPQQTFTTLPYRTIVSGTPTANVTLKANGTRSISITTNSITGTGTRNSLTRRCWIWTQR